MSETDTSTLALSVTKVRNGYIFTVRRPQYGETAPEIYVVKDDSDDELAEQFIDLINSLK